VVAFTPSFVFVLAGGRRFDRIRGDHRVRLMALAALVDTQLMPGMGGGLELKG
jgi:hypothetical protein